ncbi:MAG: hypothetical protein M3Q78_10585 [Acidobacteriota bacterium]|nr:hypothetical protein [Acidobacteriota bacterium]
MVNVKKRISVQSLFALKEALASIFWAKRDLRQFIELTIENDTIVSTVDWNGNTKFESVSQIIDRMAKRQDIYQNDLLELIQEASSFTNFDHLKKWDDYEIKVKKAKESVERLRNFALKIKRLRWVTAQPQIFQLN